MKGMSNKIAAVVVTYNRKELLLECVEKLLLQTYDTFDILLIDNHSTDGTKEAIEKFLPDSRIIYKDTGSNLGGAGGFQFGIKEAAKYDYEYVWLMDDDSMPTTDALENLVKAYEELDRPGFLSSKVLWTDGQLCKINIQRSSLTKNISDFSDRFIDAAIASFVSLFVPMSVVKDVGLPIKEFFIWTDDWEYTRRISLKYKCYVVTDSEVIHKTKSNTGANIAVDSEDRIERYRYAYRNEMYLYKREGIKGMMHVFARTPVHITRVLLYAKSKKMYRIRIILISTFDGIKFEPQTERLD